MKALHPWEEAWKTGRWKEVSPPMPAAVEFCDYLVEHGLKRVLDIGAGGGRHTLLMAGRGLQVVALDVSDTAQGLLDRRVREAGLHNVTLVRHEMGDLPFVDGYFDAVVSTNVMQHGREKDVRRAFQEAGRVLRKGGAALFVVVSDKDFRFGMGRRLEPHTFVFTSGEEKGIVHHFFDAEEVRGLLKGFRVLKLWEDLVQDKPGKRGHVYAVARKN